MGLWGEGVVARGCEVRAWWLGGVSVDFRIMQ